MTTAGMAQTVPLVSVGIPAYNEERYVRQTMDSVLAFQYPNLEVLVTDNGSADATWAMLTDFTATHPNVRLKRFEENKGAIESFNDVCRRATGKYFLWSGAHDLWDPSYVSRCVEILESHQDVVVVYARTTLIDERDRPIRGYDDSIDTRGMPMLTRYAHVLGHLRACNLLHGVWRREDLLQSGLFTLSWGPDNLIIAQMAIHGQFAQIPQVLFFRRRVRPDEDPTTRAARIQRDLTAEAALETPRIRVLRKRLRDAHLSMVLAQPVSLLAKAALWGITWYIFAVRKRVFRSLIRSCMRTLPAGLTTALRRFLRGHQRRSPAGR